MYRLNNITINMRATFWDSAVSSRWSRPTFQRCVLPPELPWWGSMHLLNVGILQRDYTALYLRRLSFSRSSPWEPKISQLLQRISIKSLFRYEFLCGFLNDAVMSSCFSSIRYRLRCRGSSVSIVSDYGLDDRAIGVRSRQGQRILPPASGAHPASCTMGTGGPFSGAKARPGRDADHSPPPSAEVVNE
jgi:hypothetical protein